MTDTNATQPMSWVCYDGDCAFCLRWLRRVEHHLLSHGFGFVPLQTPWVKARLNLPETGLLAEMRLLLPNKSILGGADGAVILARHVWWLWPLWLASFIPGAMIPMRAGYRFVAKRRRCASNRCDIHKGGRP